MKLERLGVPRLALEDQRRLLGGLRHRAHRLERARQLHARRVEVRVQFERARQRHQRVVEVALLELRRAQQVVEVGIGIATLERLAHQRGGTARLAGLDEPAIALEQLVHRCVREAQRPLQQHACLLPVSALQALEPLPEGVRLLDAHFLRQRPELVERLAHQAVGRVQQRALQARRAVARVQGERGVSVAPLVWTVRDTVIYGGFEGPAGLYLIEGTVDGGCNIVKAAASDYTAGEPMAVVGTVIEGMFRHNGPVRVTYRMRKEG